MLQFLGGVNGANLVRGLRLGLPELVSGSFASFQAAHPRQTRAEVDCQRNAEAIPEVGLEHILGGRKPEIRLRVQRYEDGMMPSHEVMALLSILVAESPREVLEIGTFMGHTTRAMAENLDEGVIHTVDLPPDFAAEAELNGKPPKDDFHLIRKRMVGREFNGRDIAGRILQHFGDTAELDFKTLGHPTFFFIDGSHTYEYCKQDSEKCLELCNGKGTFLWHDCDLAHPGIIQFLLEWRKLGRDVVRIHGTCIGYWKAE